MCLTQKDPIIQCGKKEGQGTMKHTKRCVPLTPVYIFYELKYLTSPSISRKW